MDSLHLPGLRCSLILTLWVALGVWGPLASITGEATQSRAGQVTRVLAEALLPLCSAPTSAGTAHQQQEEEARERGRPGLQSAEASAEWLHPRGAVRTDPGEGEQSPRPPCTLSPSQPRRGARGRGWAKRHLSQTARVELSHSVSGRGDGGEVVSPTSVSTYTAAHRPHLPERRLLSPVGTVSLV